MKTPEANNRSDELTIIERKFIVPSGRLQISDLVPRHKIKQGYLAIDANGAETKLRSKDGKHSLIVKQGHGLVRTVISENITKQFFDKFWPSTDGREVSKTRYQIPLGAEVAKLDVFGGNLAKLALSIVEVEFSTIEEANEFNFPDWFGNEVTGDRSFSNQSLALMNRALGSQI